MISSGVPHADQVRWLPEACSEAPMQANLGAELGRGGDRLRAGSCIFLLDFEAFFFEVGRTIFGIAFNVGVFVTVAGALNITRVQVDLAESLVDIDTADIFLYRVSDNHVSTNHREISELPSHRRVQVHVFDEHTWRTLTSDGILTYTSKQ